LNIGAFERDGGIAKDRLRLWECRYRLSELLRNDSDGSELEASLSQLYQ